MNDGFTEVLALNEHLPVKILSHPGHGILEALWEGNWTRLKFFEDVVP